MCRYTGTRTKGVGMRLVIRVCILAVFSASAGAQGRSPEPGVWWAITPDAPIDERVQITATPNGPMITSVRLGKAPVDWGPIAAQADSTIVFSYSGDRL